MKMLLAAAAIASLLVLDRTAASAQEPPALANAPTPDEKSRIAALIEAARAEGQVSYIDQIVQPATAEILAKAFRQDYGLPASFRVNYALMTSTNAVTRIDQELKANRVSVDVVSTSSVPWVYERVRAGDVLEYNSPEYSAFEHAFEKGIGERGYFAFASAYFVVPMWNRDKLQFSGKSWKDVVDAVPAGRISVGDASVSETYLDDFMGLRKALGADFFKAIADKHPSFLSRSEQVTSRVVSGEDLLTLGGMPTRAYLMNQKGAKLSYMVPREGVVLIPQATFILKNTACPAAAKLWLDFLLSEKGQEIIVGREAVMSGRSKFRSPLPDYSPSIDDLNIIAVDWKSITPAEMQKARDEWSAIFRR